MDETLKVKLSLLTVLCNATGIYRRTIPTEKKSIYQQNLKGIISELIEKVDNGTIKNADIRNSIKKLSDSSGVSTGAAQKAINVYLKFYCIISNKDKKVLSELDCPLDSIVQKEYGLGKIPLKDMNFDTYVGMQKKLGESFEIRIYADKAYDEKKIYR
jgi:hypothetical protein